MGKWAVIYSSITGNTRQIAETIAKAGGADIFTVQEAPDDIAGYEVIFLGYWLRRGGPDPAMSAYLAEVHDKKVAFFETHGVEKGAEHAVTALARAAYRLGKGCEILATFDCQGKINPALTAKRAKLGPANPHGGAKALARWQGAASHPDADDIAAAEAYVRAVQQKLMLRQRSAERQRRED
jgi:flavodoxin